MHTDKNRNRKCRSDAPLMVEELTDEAVRKFHKPLLAAQWRMVGRRGKIHLGEEVEGEAYEECQGLDRFLHPYVLGQLKKICRGGRV